MSGTSPELNIKSIYQHGYRALPQKISKPVSVLQTVDLSLALESQNPKKVIELIEPQVLYHSLMVQGREDFLDVILHMSQEQFVRMMDYDIWSKDLLDFKKASQWLVLCKALGNDELVKRFRELDEEYQISLLEGKIAVYDEEEYEKLPDHERDKLNVFPGHEMWYRIMIEDEKDVETIQMLVDASISTDIRYAMSLLAHAYAMPPNESVEQLARFRKARLEEDGFVSFDEAQKVFLPVDIEYLKNHVAKIQPDHSMDEKSLAVYDEFGHGESYMDAVMRSGVAWWSDDQREIVQSSIGYLANAICSAVDIEPDDLESYKRIMDQIRATMSLSLQYFSNCNENVAAELLVIEHPQILFRGGLTLVRQAAQRVLVHAEELELANVSEIRELYDKKLYGECLNLIDVSWMGVYDFELIEMIKGILNRFPMYPKSKIEKDGVEKVLFVPVDSLSKLTDLESQLMIKLGDYHAH